MDKTFKWLKFFPIMLVLVVFAANFAYAQDDDDEDLDPPHYYYIQKYEGTKTCLKCHMKEAEDVFHSLHYQWSADASAEDLIGIEPGTKVGKFHDINDFCTNPKAPWIDRYVNKDGKVIVDGCSKCHIGFGKKPGEKITEEELENIDCLMCHAPGYSRKIVEKDGKLQWVPNMSDDLLTLRAKNVMKPTAAMCLKCHIGAGGGANYKRGDLEMAHYEAEEDLDVHFANDMACTDCHTTRNHRIAGRGVDLAARDLPGEKVACENCHDAEPHESDILNKHTESVYCTVCHIPDFARYDATDVYRDWSKVEERLPSGKYVEHHVTKKNVIPAYMWWNGKTVAQDPHKPAKAVNGYVKIMYPDGSINDPNAKIYAVKRHVAKLPILKKERLILPVNVNTVFKYGDINKAVIEGAKAFFGKDITEKDYEWIKVERYMGLFHEVVPGDKALKCQDCHGKNGRMDWKALGYKGDPKKYGGRFSQKKK